jgi:hypothetical protein
MSRTNTYLPALCLVLLLPAVVLAQVPAAPPSPPAFGLIKGPTFDEARTQAFAWLQQVGADAATLQRAEALWSTSEDRSLLERVAETLMLGDAEAQNLILTARDGSKPVATAVPDILKDAKRPVFFRANLALYYAKQLAARRIHEEALEALKPIRPEQVVDPASYYFFKAVCENKLLHKEEGLQSVDRLLHSVADVPERYQVVATLMKHEMDGWEDKDLGYIARRMEEIEGRLGNARGGPKTQAKQKEVIDLLDKTIKEIEEAMNQQQQQQQQQANRNRNPQDNNRSQRPLDESMPIGGAGEGKVDARKLIKNLDEWGKLPEKEKIRALEAISREYPPHVREAIEGYLRRSASNGSGPGK